ASPCSACAAIVADALSTALAAVLRRPRARLSADSDARKAAAAELAAAAFPADISTAFLATLDFAVALVAARSRIHLARSTGLSIGVGAGGALAEASAPGARLARVTNSLLAFSPVALASGSAGDSLGAGSSRGSTPSTAASPGTMTMRVPILLMP